VLPGASSPPVPEAVRVALYDTGLVKEGVWVGMKGGLIKDD